MFRVTEVFLILFLNYFILSKCSQARFYDERMDNKIIQRKRQDTLELCKIFRAQTDGLSPAVKRSKRVKRDNYNDDIGDPNVLQRVEEIVETMYDDINVNQSSKVTYKRRFNVIKESTVPNRRYDFAPSKFDDESETTTFIDNQPTYTEDDSWQGPFFNWPKKWIHGIVPYFIDPLTYDFDNRVRIESAFQFFEKMTCIRLQKLDNKPTDKASLERVEWIYITNPTGIYQCVHTNDQKPSKGVQMVILGYDCMSPGEIAHEVMHILGFSHEHTRPDRNNHITILWDNIKPGYKKYFIIQKDYPFSDIPYDYASVLHYPARAFSRNGKQTIQPKITSKLGQRETLSQGDVEKVNLVFNSQCVARNTKYLLRTCPIVLDDPPEPFNMTKSEIKNYFKSRIFTNETVYYHIRDNKEFSFEELSKIEKAFNVLSKYTCLTFINTKVEYEAEAVDDDHPLVEPLKSSMEMNNSEIVSQEVNYRRKLKRRHNEILAANTTMTTTKTKTTDTTKTTNTTSNEPTQESIKILRSSESGCKCPSTTADSIVKTLTINADCFTSAEALFHLFLHVLGLKHQHNMYDRDSYLKIEWDILSPELKEELNQKLPPEESLGLPYDYHSVMHIPFLSIKDGVQNLIYPVWNDAWYTNKKDGLSYLDIEKIKLIQC